MNRLGRFARAACTMLIGSMSLSFGASASDCGALYLEHQKTDMSLDFLAFDQSPKGFRALSEGADCYKQAGDLIEEYMKGHGDLLPLRWHLAQMRALAGDYRSAIESARRAMQPAGGPPGHWNDYVLGTIAFLERNKEELVLRRNKVSEGATQADSANAKVLDRLTRNFEATYKDALLAKDDQ